MVCVTALAVVAVNLLITLRWKISQHVSSIAVCATVATAVLGVSAAPTLLLIPLVAWARVKVGAHTVLQTVAGATVGVAITLGAARLLGIL
jgi:membrane-associated phospholipid phosphatase